MRGLFKDWSMTAWMTGFIAVLVSYSGPLVIFIQAAQAGGMSADMLSSWIWAISVGSGLSGIILSVWLREPIITAWSAPGTALLINLFPEISMAEVVGAYLLAALATIAIGLSGYFERIVRLIPSGIAGAMMAGILFQFGIQAFHVSSELPGLVFAMLAVYLVCRRIAPTFTIIVVAVVGFVLAHLMGLTQFSALELSFARPIFIVPEFSFGAFVSFTLPLLIVSLSGQYLPGMVVMRLAGYREHSRPIVSVTGIASALVAFFGGISIVLAAITAALCTGEESHKDKDKRYVAGIANGVFYLIGGTLAGSIVLLFTALPAALIATLAGLALLGAILTNIRLFVEDTDYLEPSLITFLATASGMSIGGFGAAFWGIALGLIAHAILSGSLGRWCKHYGRVLVKR
ncbi:MAG TPA: benzoate/H(+) symporter BenE family transporter [Paenalcaligenes sp.]|nr:benzoate/H(+) symporter BenE family transporter [Paenalcaligenes sp.]